jgi:hypothetical protein
MLRQQPRDHIWKHLPDFNTAERLAKALGVPTPYLYVRDDMLVALLLAWGKLTPEARGERLAIAKMGYGAPGTGLSPPATATPYKND